MKKDEPFRIPKNMRPKVIKIIRLVEKDGLTTRAACKKVGISKSSFYRYQSLVQNDKRLDRMRDTVENGIREDTEAIIDSQKEHQADLSILNHLLGRLLDGVDKGTWTPDQVEERLVKLVDAKGRLLGQADKRRDMVQALYVDQRQVTIENMTPEARQFVLDEVVKDIWDCICDDCKEALRGSALETG
jgi:AcrR family transcriptional regulator